MSGNTSETRCDKCYFLACPCAGHGVCGCVCHAEPTPPEGEAVPEQQVCEHNSVKNYVCVDCGVEFLPCRACSGANGTDFWAVVRHAPPVCESKPAPVVSTAAPEPPPIVLHCQECNELITFNGSYNQWFHADGTSTYPKCTRPKPVAPESYKPAEGALNNIFEALAESVAEMSDEDILAEAAEQGIDIDAQDGAVKKLMLDAIESCKTAAATPVTVEAPDVCPRCEGSGKYQRLPGDTEKDCAICDGDGQIKDPTRKPIGDVEAVARKIVRYYSRAKFPHVAAKHNLAIIAILSPFFAPAGPETWPQHCHLCNQDMESVDDRMEWHGLGNCVPVCMVCMGSGIELPKTPAQPPCSECATLQEKLEIAQRYGQREYAIEQILRGDLATAVNECATLRKERDDAQSELFLSGVELTKQRSFAIVARLNAALWKGKLQAAEAQLSTLRDALEKGEVAVLCECATGNAGCQKCGGAGLRRSKGKHDLRRRIRFLQQRIEILEAELIVARAPEHLRTPALAPTPEVAPHMTKVSAGIFTSTLCTCLNQNDEDGAHCPICGKLKSVNGVAPKE